MRVVEIGDGFIVLQSLTSDNRFVEPMDYHLASYDPEKRTSEARPHPYWERNGKPKSPPHQGRDLASIIDPLLLAGGKTMRGILRELRRKASAACRGRDLEANIRARIYWLRKRGRQVGVRRTLTPCG